MEIKASLPDWPDYMVTNTGAVLSYKGKDRAERILKTHSGSVSLRRGGKTYTRTVRSLMIQALWNPPDDTSTHCAAGHPYSKYGMPPLESRPHVRRCRKCHAIRMARWRAKKRATATRTG